MAITSTNQNTQNRYDPRGFTEVEALTYSTATAAQALDLFKDVSVLPGTTATSGFTNGRYFLPTAATAGAIEGKVHLVSKDATGPAWLIAGAAGAVMGGRLRLQAAWSLLSDSSTATDLNSLNATATGAWNFTASNQYGRFLFVNGLWDVLDIRGATMATALA